MTALPAGVAPTYLTEPEACAYLHVGRTTLRRWRRQGTGPRFRRHATVVYSVHDLDAWSAERAHTSTAAERAARGAA